MHISEAVKAHPRLEGILKDEFDKRTWYRLMTFGEQAKCYKGVPKVNVVVKDTAMKGPLRFYKEIEEGSGSIKYIIL